VRVVDLSKVTVISIIDDDECVREATNCLVRSLGYNTVSFACAEDFLASERLHEIDCLITDVQMPGMSGVELHSRLIADGHETPVIFITAFPDDAIRTRVLEAGACGYLGKPFKEESLIDCLHLALKRRQ
jgi:FixJ family two-component response regulator